MFHLIYLFDRVVINVAFKSIITRVLTLNYSTLSNLSNSSNT